MVHIRAARFKFKRIIRKISHINRPLLFKGDDTKLDVLNSK